MSQTQTQSRWKTGFKFVHDKAFAGLDRLGAQVNKGAGKIGVEGFWPGPMVGEIEKATRILRAFTSNEMLDVSTTTTENGKKKQKVLVKIPPNLIRGAQGLAIFTVFRTGFGFSAASGSGVVISRDREGTWGPPSGILIHTIGFGFLAGIDVYDVVLILRNRKAVQAFANPKVSLGAEISVAAGPLGAGAIVDSGIEATPVLSYVKSKGLYGGAQVDGTIVIERTDENARFYGRQIKAREILAEDSRVEVPVGSEILHIAIASAEGWVSSAEEQYSRKQQEDRRRSYQIDRYGEEGADAIARDPRRASMPAVAVASASDLQRQEQWQAQGQGQEKYEVDEDEYEDRDAIKLHDNTTIPEPSSSSTPPPPPPPRASTSPPPPVPPRRRPTSDSDHLT